MYAHDDNKIKLLLSKVKTPSKARVEEILLKAELKKGLSLEESAELLKAKDPSAIKSIFRSAWKVKDAIYGDRLVFFAPIYISDLCVNDCEYCGFHCRNKALKRKKLSMDEVREQTRILIKMGHKRLLLEAGEHPEVTIDYVCDAIRAIYSTKAGKGEIRRVNVNIAATTIENFRKLKDAGIGTYQLFQETYHPGTYAKLHRGPKADYERQITAHERAFKAGIDDFGMGVLFGLYDHRYEVLSLLAHAKYMDSTYGVGPQTISVPRFRPAQSVAFVPQYLVSDADFLRLIAVIRLSLPYTGMIISTRETPAIRAKAFKIGISQTSAASRTSPGGYSTHQNAQFETSDERSLDDVVLGTCRQGLLPSFCTACYRSRRTGEAFMKLAKAGKIHYLCRPNAILTFKEFLIDYASPELKKAGEATIRKELMKIEDPERRAETRKRLVRVEKGERDLYF